MLSAYCFNKDATNVFFSIKTLWHDIYTKSTVLGLFKCSMLRGMPVHKLSYAETMGIAQCKVHVFLKIFCKRYAVIALSS